VGNGPNGVYDDEKAGYRSSGLVMPSASTRRRFDTHAQPEVIDVRGLKVETRNGGRDVLLSVQGEVDLATAPELEEALERALEVEGRRLVVDLRGVAFLDSTGLALILRHDRRARAAARRLIVVKGPPHVQKAFELTGLNERLTMIDRPPA
jgi:anti-sigma B factor antagonist